MAGAGAHFMFPRFWETKKKKEERRKSPQTYTLIHYSGLQIYKDGSRDMFARSGFEEVVLNGRGRGEGGEEVVLNPVLKHNQRSPRKRLDTTDIHANCVVIKNSL